MIEELFVMYYTYVPVAIAVIMGIIGFGIGYNKIFANINNRTHM